MRFSANVSILFKEVPLLERFGRAATAGFSAVEFWWPGHEAELGRYSVPSETPDSTWRSSTSTPVIWRPGTGGW